MKNVVSISKKQNVQQVARSAFDNADSRCFVLTNDFFALLTVMSVLAIVCDTVESLQKYDNIFLIVEYVTVFFFSIEYIARIIAAKKPSRYIFSFFGIIDLIAIIPTFLGLTNLTFLKSARLLRMLRFLRMLRLAKLLRLQKITADEESPGHKGLLSLTVQIYIITLFTVIIMSATLMWFLEGEFQAFANIPLAMIWSSKVLLGGVPQAMPQTISGEIITIFTRFMGLVLFSLLVSIVGGGVSRLLLGSEDRGDQKK